MAKTYIQVRAEEADKEKASEILDELGTNLSAVVNMLLKQIIMTKSIPFEVKMASGLDDKKYGHLPGIVGEYFNIKVRSQ